MSSEMYLDIEVYLSEYLQSSQVYHGACLYGTTAVSEAGADTNISIYNRWERNPGLGVTDRDTGVPPRPRSRSVTSWAPKPLLLLQIETLKICRKVCLDL